MRCWRALLTRAGGLALLSSVLRPAAARAAAALLVPAAAALVWPPVLAVFVFTPPLGWRWSTLRLGTESCRHAVPFLEPMHEVIVFLIPYRPRPPGAVIVHVCSVFHCVAVGALVDLIRICEELGRAKNKTSCTNSINAFSIVAVSTLRVPLAQKSISKPSHLFCGPPLPPHTRR